MAVLRGFVLCCLLVLASSYPRPKENGHQGTPKKDDDLLNLKSALAKLTQQVKDYTAATKTKTVERYHDDKLSLEQSLDAAVAEDAIKVKVGPVLEDASENVADPDILDTDVDDMYEIPIDKSEEDFDEYNAGNLEITEDVPIKSEIVHPEIIKKEVPDKEDIPDPEISDVDVSDEIMDQDIEMHLQEDETAHKALAAIKKDLGGLINDFKGMKSELVKVSDNEIRSTYKSKLDEVKFDIDDILLDFKEVKKHLASEFPSDGKSQNDEILDGQLSHDDMTGLLGDMNDMITNARLKVQEIRDDAKKPAAKKPAAKKAQGDEEEQDAKKGGKKGGKGNKDKAKAKIWLRIANKTNAACEDKGTTSDLCASAKKTMDLLNEVKADCAGGDSADCTASKAELETSWKEFSVLAKAAAKERMAQRITKIKEGCEQKNLTSALCAAAKKAVEALEKVEADCAGGDQSADCTASKEELKKSMKKVSGLAKAAARERMMKKINKENTERCTGTDGTSDICVALKKAIDAKMATDDKCASMNSECRKAWRSFFAAAKEARKLIKAEGKGEVGVTPTPVVPPTDGNAGGGTTKKDETASELLNLKSELNDVLTEFKELKGRIEKKRDEKTKGEKKISFPRMDELKSQLHLLTDEMKSFKDSMREDYYADLTDDDVKVAEEFPPKEHGDTMEFDEDEDLF